MTPDLAAELVREGIIIIGKGGSWWFNSKVRPSPRELFCKRMAAIRYLRARPHLWKGLKIERGHPMKVTPAWADICHALKDAGIYSRGSSNWDLRIDAIVRELQKDDKKPSQSRKK